MYKCTNMGRGGEGLKTSPLLMHSLPHTPTTLCNGGVTAIRAIFTLSERKCLLLNEAIKKAIIPP